VRNDPGSRLEYAAGVLCCAVLRRYLAGVLDFTGELNRYAVGRATARDVAAVQRARDVVDALQGQFLQMDLRNGSLR
jgi:predicted translin family RNA/ssDNA-binding protein